MPKHKLIFLIIIFIFLHDHQEISPLYPGKNLGTSHYSVSEVFIFYRSPLQMKNDSVAINMY